MFSAVWVTWSLSHLFSSPTVVLKQPKAGRKWMTVAVFQSNFIYGHCDLNFISLLCVTKSSYWCFFYPLKMSNPLIASWWVS